MTKKQTREKQTTTAPETNFAYRLVTWKQIRDADACDLAFRKRTLARILRKAANEVADTEGATVRDWLFALNPDRPDFALTSVSVAWGLRVCADDRGDLLCLRVMATLLTRARRLTPAERAMRQRVLDGVYELCMHGKDIRTPQVIAYADLYEEIFESMGPLTEFDPHTPASLRQTHLIRHVCGMLLCEAALLCWGVHTHKVRMARELAGRALALSCLTENMSDMLHPRPWPFLSYFLQRMSIDEVGWRKRLIDVWEAAERGKLYTRQRRTAPVPRDQAPVATVTT